jgi:hypothetical protein
LLAVGACGGERKDAASGAATDTTTPAAAPAPAPADTATKADTGMKADSAKNQSVAPKDSTRTTAAAAPAKPKKAAAPSPSKPADTAAAAGPAKAADSGATQTASADAPLRDQYHQPPRDTVSQEVYNGWKQFNLNCARCHGEDVTGTTIAPHLIVSLKPDGPINTKELFMSTVCSGRPAKGMPAWCSLGLGMDKIQEIYSYVKGRSDGKLAPGRPAVRSQG